MVDEVNLLRNLTLVGSYITSSRHETFQASVVVEVARLHLAPLNTPMVSKCSRWMENDRQVLRIPVRNAWGWKLQSEHHGGHSTVRSFLRMLWLGPAIEVPQYSRRGKVLQR